MYVEGLNMVKRQTRPQQVAVTCGAADNGTAA